MTIWALLPVKRLDIAKTRLACVLSPGQRRALVLAMMEDVLTALMGVSALDGVAVVTADDAAIRLAGRYGARVITAAADHGYNAAVQSGCDALALSRVDAVLTLPLDVPMVTQAELLEIVALCAGNGPCFAIVPSQDGGTNAALRAGPHCVPPLYGADSFRAHCMAARRAGLTPRVAHLAGLRRDIDTPADLRVLMRHGNKTRAAAALAKESLH